MDIDLRTIVEFNIYDLNIEIHFEEDDSTGIPF